MFTHGTQSNPNLQPKLTPFGIDPDPTGVVFVGPNSMERAARQPGALALPWPQPPEDYRWSKLRDQPVLVIATQPDVHPSLIKTVAEEIHRWGSGNVAWVVRDNDVKVITEVAA